MSKKLQILPLDITVTPNEQGNQRIEIFSKGDDFSNIYCLNEAVGFSVGGQYKVIGTMQYVFEDRSSELVYLMFNDNGVLVERATKFFNKV